MANLSEKAITIVSELNEQLFEAEYKLEAQQHAVSKYRYYLAADANSETVLDLRGAVANLRAYQKRANELRARLEQALDRVFEITVQGDDAEGMTDEQADREFAAEHPRMAQVQALMEKAAEAKKLTAMQLETAIAQELTTRDAYTIGHPWHEVMWAEVRHEGNGLYSVTTNEDDEMFGDTSTQQSHVSGIKLGEAAMAVYLFLRSN